MAHRNDTLDRVLTEFPPLIKHFADTRELFADAIESLGRLSDVADQTLSDTARANLHPDLQLLAATAAGNSAGPRPMWSAR